MLFRSERFYYLQLLHRAGILTEMPESPEIRLVGASREAGAARFAQHGLPAPIIGVSPGAAFGTAKRWLPERFAETANLLARELGASVAIFGSQSERDLCAGVAKAIHAPVHNFAGETTLADYIDLTSACHLYLSNDSGAMHIASALGVPTVTVFGATNHITTGPTGVNARIVRENVECSPCQKRECPIDHRCMTRVAASRVAQVALELLK